MKNFFAYLLLGLLFAACSQEDAFLTNSKEERVPLVINAVQEGTTRVKDNMWEEGDAIGVVIFQEGDDVNPVAFNLKYVRTAEGKFVADKSDKTIGDQTFYLKKGIKYRVVAYYPWTNYANEREGNPFLSKEDGTTYLSIDLKDQSDFSKIDVLVSQSVYEINKDNEEVELYFRHILMKWIVNIHNKTNGITEKQMEDLKCEAKYQQSLAQISLSNLSFKDTGKWNLEYLPIKVSEKGTKAEAILHPKQENPNLFFTLQIEQNKRTANAILMGSLFNNMDKNMGTQYTISVKVRLKP